MAFEGHSFKKQYGQNFLKSTRFGERLVEILEVKEGDNVIEIGPGDGKVTNILLAKGAKVIAIEIDYDLLPNLIKRFSSNPNFNLVHEDILKIELDELVEKYDLSGEVKIIGALPYNISKRIIDKFINYSVYLNNKQSKVRVRAMSFILQEEVAKDYVAKAPKSSFLSNYANVFTEAKKFETIPASQFHPVPRVNGGIILFEFREDIIENYNDLVKLIRVGFSSPRKTLANNLKNSKKWETELINNSIKEIGLSESVRPAEVDGGKWVELFRKLS